MSSGSIEKDKEEHFLMERNREKPLKLILSEIIIPFSSVIEQQSYPYIYEGDEKIPFQQRHPIYKAMMKIEFEEALRQFWVNKNEKK
jgi:hypothetical protein